MEGISIMIDKIKINGIYFCQKDMIEDGFLFMEVDEKLIWKKYIKPTSFEKLKYKLKYGYSMNTETISTSFYYFDKSETGKVHINSLLCDAITLVKKEKSFIYNSPILDYYLLDDTIIIDKNSSFTELKIGADGDTIFSKRVEKNPLKYFNTNIYHYLDLNQNY